MNNELHFLMSGTTSSILIIFCLLGMAVIFLFVSEIIEVNAMRIAGYVSLGLAAFIIGRIIYRLLKRWS